MGVFEKQIVKIWVISGTNLEDTMSKDMTISQIFDRSADSSKDHASW